MKHKQIIKKVQSKFNNYTVTFQITKFVIMIKILEMVCRISGKILRMNHFYDIQNFVGPFFDIKKILILMGCIQLECDD